MRDILYIDMDGVIADFEKAIKKLIPNLDELPKNEREDAVDAACAVNRRIFLDLEVMPKSIFYVSILARIYDVYFLSSPMSAVPESFTDKALWLQKRFGDFAKKRLILSHRKDLNIGSYLVDDRTANGAGAFTGEHIHIGTEKFPDWGTVFNYLIVKHQEKETI